MGDLYCHLGPWWYPDLECCWVSCLGLWSYDSWDMFWSLWPVLPPKAKWKPGALLLPDPYWYECFHPEPGCQTDLAAGYGHVWVCGPVAAGADEISGPCWNSPAFFWPRESLSCPLLDTVERDTLDPHKRAGPALRRDGPTLHHRWWRTNPVNMRVGCWLHPLTWVGAQWPRLISSATPRPTAVPWVGPL